MEPPSWSGGKRAAVVGLLALLGSASTAGARLADAPPPPGAAPVAPAAPPAATLELVADTAALACATRGDLLARVAARSSRVRFVDDAGPGPRLRVEVAREAGGVSATLQIRGSDGARPARRLRAATCDDALDAVAVMIVVFLDPTAALAAPPAPPPAPAPAAPTNGVAIDGAPGGPEPLAPPWGAALAVGGHAISGPAPRLMPGITVDAVVLRQRTADEGLWSPAVRLRWSHDWLDDWPAPGGSATFVLDSLELDLCPLALGAARLVARGCLMALGSRVSANGSRTFSAESHVRFLIAPGAAAWLALRLGRRLQVEAGLAAGANLVRDSFAFQPDAFYRVAPVAVTGSVGLGMTFQ